MSKIIYGVYAPLIISPRVHMEFNSIDYGVSECRVGVLVIDLKSKRVP